MAVNRDKPGKWKADIARSVDTYNDWFMKFAPKAFRETRIQTTRDVEEALRSTGNLTNIAPATMRTHPEILPTLRMSTCPPLAVDRLIGLASVSPNFVKCMEIDKKLPAKTSIKDADAELALAWLRQRGVPLHSIILYGYSLGGGVASAAALGSTGAGGFSPKILRATTDA